MQNVLRLHLSAALVALAVLCLPRAAHADVLAIDFGVGISEAPGGLCVIWQAQPNPADENPPLELNDKLAFFTFTETAPASGLFGVELTADPGNANKNVEALGLLRRPQPVCTAANECKPVFSVELKKNLPKRMRCTRNTQIVSSKVAFIELQTTGTLKSDIPDIFLHGLVGRVQLARKTDLDALTAVVVGGDYRPGLAGNTLANRVQLDLSPRCVERTLPVPRLGHHTADLSTRILLSVSSPGGQAIETTCDVPGVASKRVWVPAGAVGLGSRVQVQVLQGGTAIGIQRADWTSEYPPETVQLRSVFSSFVWKAACEVPEGAACPQVSMTDTGVECDLQRFQSANIKLQSCSYTCGQISGDGPAFDQPARLHFSGARQEVGWESWLSYPGQVVEGAYLNSAVRRFVVDLMDLPDHARYGDKYPSVDITLPTGTHLRVRVEGRDEADQTIVLPGVACGQQVAYNWIGSRRYHEATVQIRSGTLHIAPPEASSEEATLGASINGGFMFANDDANTVNARPYGILELSYRKAWGPHVPWPCNDGFCPMPHAYEVHGTYVISQQPFVPARPLDGDAESRSEQVAYNRFILTLMPIWHLGDYIQTGLGVGVGVGYAVLDMDNDKVGKPRVFAAVTSLWRYPLTKQLAFELLLQYLPRQDYVRFENDPSYSKSPAPKIEGLGFLATGLGVRAWM